MISLKRYLDAPDAPDVEPGEPARAPVQETVLPSALEAYRSALKEVGACSLEVCPGLGDRLNRDLRFLAESLDNSVSARKLTRADEHVRKSLHEWGQHATEHNQQKTKEVKEMLIVMVRTAESLGERDQHCARQIDAVTERLGKIASLEDLTLIRASIEESAAELKTSIERMTAEGKAAIEQLRAEVSIYQARLEEAETISSRDSLTGLRSRLRMETELERQIELRRSFCVAIIDIDDFKKVNDEHGHVVGDELLQQFAVELRSASRTTDVIGRWGGDEFTILLECPLGKASAQIDRLRDWICGTYTVQSPSGIRKLKVGASIGIAEYRTGETLKSLIDRADADMYRHKPGGDGKA